MPPLATDLRRDLERTITTARDVAEVGVRAALEALTVHEGKAGAHLSKAQRGLRNRLRAHGRQLGDRLHRQNLTAEDAERRRGEEKEISSSSASSAVKKGSMTIDHLVQECAYEHWHRMIFARFLAENDLLIEPESGVSVTLEEVEELARDAGVDQWELASRFAQATLPQIFRPDDPVLAVPLPTETRLELESLLESLPAAVFTADDSLGWVYQFWQSKKKDEVNASGKKITGETLPAVTQLFTEHYMVLFLLHNTVGAWWAGKRLTAEDAETEEELRGKLALHGVDWDYLRFVREEKSTTEGTEQRGEKEKLTAEDAEVRRERGINESSPLRPSASSAVKSPFRPAAGTFDGWPKTAADLKVLDPCCGSGHFLVAVFELLTRLRMDEEGLSAEDAARAVFRDNLFGLEIDPRCTQIAVFALAFAAWKMVGRVIDLPPLNIACSGIGPSATLDEWLKLAEKAEHNLPRHAREPVRNGLENLHRLFSHAPELGSLIDPTELPSNLIAADYETLQPFLEEVFKREAADVESRERAIAAQGMVHAAEFLAGEYDLVITNVPYLGRGKQDEILKSHLEEHYGTGKADLATAMVLRCLDFCVERNLFRSGNARAERNGTSSVLPDGTAGTVALVTPQNWLFLTSYKKLRESLLKERTWNAVARLGPGAFETISGHVVNVALLVLSATKPGEAAAMAGIDVSAPRGQQPIHAAEKAALLRGETVERNLFRSRPLPPDPERNKFRSTNNEPATKSRQSGPAQSPEQAAPLRDETVEAASSRLAGEIEQTLSTRQDAASTIILVPQAEQLKVPDARIAFDTDTSLDRLEQFAICRLGLGTGDAPHYLRQFWELESITQTWSRFQTTTDNGNAVGGYDSVVAWDTERNRVFGMSDAERKQGHNQDYRGREVWGRRGVAVSIMSELKTCAYGGDLFDKLVAAIVPANPDDIAPVYCFVRSEEFVAEVRKLDQKLMVTNATLVKVPFDLEHWQKVAAEKYPNGLPEPESDDPTQWLFHGRPEASTALLQVAVARLLGYRWPAELEELTAEGAEGRRGEEETISSTLSPRSSASSAVNSPMRLSERARELVRRCDELLKYADPDGIVCLPAVRTEATAAERLRRMLAAAECEGQSLDEWLRDKFFEQHCKLFHHRPFIWHIWDGRKDGFHALVNYHKLCGGFTAEGAEGRRGEERQATFSPRSSASSAVSQSGHKLLETLTYAYLGDWITRQQHGVKQNEPGAEARLAAAKTLQEELKKILDGEPPYDIFVRWKPLDEQPIGWEPDINDGVRLNIRPFLKAKDVGRKGAGILRFKPNIKWKKDRGKEPQRDKDDFPWFWSWDEQAQDFRGGDTFDGNRWNDLHYTNAFKQSARERARS